MPMQKLTTIILLLIVLASPLGAQSFKYKYQGVEFRCKLSKGAVSVKGFDEKARQVTIPATVTYKGVAYPVVQVSTFLNGVNYLATSLVLEEGIEDIDKFSFNEFRRLTSVRLPASIRHIGKNAFRDNKGLVFDMLASIDEQSLRNGVELDLPGTGERRLFGQADPSKPAKPAPIATKPVKPDIDTKPNPKPIPTPKSTPSNVDVDINIPKTTVKNANTCCVIIANESYKDVPAVEFAERDGAVFREYCIKVLGVPEKQIKTFINASYTDIKRALTWIENAMEVKRGNGRVIFYYAGHGIPSEKDKTAYLIPVDGFPKDLTTCFKLSELYARLGKIKSESVTVFLDACFSGVNRGSGQTLVAARGVAIKPKAEPLGGNMVVFTAASGDETALSYQEKRHGMFTYFLLKKLKETKGKVTFGELYEAISSGVGESSLFENDKRQTPSVNVSTQMGSKWKDLHF